MKKKNECSIPMLRKKLRYEPSTGNLYSLRTGKRVGGRQGNYLTVWVSGSRRIFAHRIAWALSYGRWPVEIDHINGVGTDNRICNLREADRVLQSQNVALGKNNSTGVTGVCPCAQTGKFKATINIGGRQIWLGRYSTIERAAAARKSAEQKLGWTSRE